MNVNGLFRPGAGEKQPDISQADLMKILGHGKKAIKRFFVS
jgi:hypothetical protein